MYTALFIKTSAFVVFTSRILSPAAQQIVTLSRVNDFNDFPFCAHRLCASSSPSSSPFSVKESFSFLCHFTGAHARYCVQTSIRQSTRKRKRYKAPYVTSLEIKTAWRRWIGLQRPLVFYRLSFEISLWNVSRDMLTSHAQLTHSQPLTRRGKKNLPRIKNSDENRAALRENALRVTAWGKGPRNSACAEPCTCLCARFALFLKWDEKAVIWPTVL